MKILLCRIATILIALSLTIPILTACENRIEGLPKQIETEHFIIYSEKEDIPLANSISKSLEGVYEELLQKFDATLTRKTTILVFPTHEAYRQAFASKGAPDSWEMPDSWSYGFAWQDDATIFLPSNRVLKNLPTEDSYEKIAIHEFVHMITYSKNNSVPDYIDEGIAGYTAGQKEYYKVEAVMRWLYNTDQFPTIRELELMDSTIDGFYPICYSYIEFIDATYGFEKVLEIIDADDINYLSTFNCTEDEFRDNWIQFVADNY